MKAKMWVWDVGMRIFFLVFCFFVFRGCHFSFLFVFIYYYFSFFFMCVSCDLCFFLFFNVFFCVRDNLFLSCVFFVFIRFFIPQERYFYATATHLLYVPYLFLRSSLCSTDDESSLLKQKR